MHYTITFRVIFPCFQFVCVCTATVRHCPLLLICVTISFAPFSWVMTKKQGNDGCQTANQWIFLLLPTFDTMTKKMFEVLQSHWLWNIKPNVIWAKGKNIKWAWWTQRWRCQKKKMFVYAVGFTTISFLHEIKFRLPNQIFTVCALWMCLWRMSEWDFAEKEKTRRGWKLPGNHCICSLCK